MATTTLEGRNVVIEALKRGRRVFEIKIEASAGGDKIAEIKSLAARNGVTVAYAPKKELDRLSKTDSHQGVVAVAGQIQLQKLSDLLKANPSPFVVVLREVLYEHNLGAILRCACAAGVDAVILPPTKAHPLTPVVERVSMGASNCVGVVQESPYSALATLKKNGLSIVGVEDTGTINYFDADLRGPMAMIFGGEDAGLSLPIMEKCDIVVRVPMENALQSLNQSVSAALVMFEKVRQEKYAK